ncbi:hypothetical protein WA588_000411 [Blastocystis sp. NMH]
MTGRGLNLSGSALSNLMAVLQSRHLNCLILDNANIGEEEIQMAAASLQEMRVCKLSLNDNHIGDKGLSLLLNSISDSCDMEQLHLANNGITEQCIPSVTHFIRAHPSLHIMNLRGTPISEEVQPDLELVKSYSDCSILITDADADDSMKVEEAGDNSMEEDLSHSTVKRDFEDVSEESLLMKEAATILIGLHTFLKPIAENIPLVLPNSIDASSLTDSVSKMTQSTLATRIHEIKDKLVTTSVPYFSRSFVSSKSTGSSEVISLFAQNLVVFVSALRLPSSFQSPSGSVVLAASLASTVGTINRCGRLRIELVVLLATLLNVAPATVGGFLREQDVTGTVVGLMAEYPWNSVLHNACELFVTEVIESEEEALKLSLFTQDRLYWSLRRRIVEATKEKREKKRDVIGYVGVMLRLCAMLEVLMQKNETIGKFVETQAKEMEMAPEDLAIYREEEEKNKPLENAFTYNYNKYLLGVCWNAL